MKGLFIILVICIHAVFVNSQTSIKYSKPKNVFFYSQLSLRGGGQFDLNAPTSALSFSSASKGQRTRLVNQLFFSARKYRWRAHRGAALLPQTTFSKRCTLFFL